MDFSQILGKLKLEPVALTDPAIYLNILGVLGLIVLVLVSFKILQVLVVRFLKGRVAEAKTALVSKLFKYAAFTVVAMTVFDRIGIDLSALLGAAGIAGIAVGFAAQTSVSNVISGLFLVSEKPFQVGDIIQVADVSGIVQSIDLLSIKIQTFDNRFIRVPNETIIKSNVVNVTRFPIRRLDTLVSVSYDTDLERLMKVLVEIAAENVYVLDNPEPLIILDKFDASGINILLGTWFEKSNYLALKNSIMIDVKKRFAQEGISIPFPQMTVRFSEGGSQAAAEGRAFPSNSVSVSS